MIYKKYIVMNINFIVLFSCLEILTISLWVKFRLLA